MKYFFDTEFIEGFHKPLFGKCRHHIDLISIGIVCEDGRTYYAISNEYRYKEASDWVKENVILPMYKQEITGDRRNYIDVEDFHKYLPASRTNYQIACDIMEFTMDWDGMGLSKWLGYTDDYFKLLKQEGTNLEKPEFYGYYADYDWVVLCSLFGTMMGLPKGFPMYCRDLKQTFDETVVATGFTAKALKEQSDYPKQFNEHNALDDAKWNFELYKFLQTL